MIGTTLGNRYRIEESLGHGGMAEVYKAWDKQRSVFLALKMLRQDLAEDMVFLRRFQREAQTLEKLQHPNIVRFYGIERDGYRVFMLMDHIQGKTLQRVLFMNNGVPLDLTYINHVVNSVCAALHYAHSMGMIHCDIKPGNIMIEKSGKVLLTDFGIARMTDAATSTMVGFGTPAYMAPELVRGKDPTPQSDIYSLGVVLYEMVTGGERPFTGERAEATGTTSEKVRWEQVHLEPLSPRNYNSTLPPMLEAAILKCLNKGPKARYSSALEIVKAVKSSSLKIQSSSVVGYQEEQREAQNIVDKGEGIEADAFTGTLEGSVSRPKGRSNKKRLPAWLPWGLLGVIAVVMVLVLAFGRGGGGETEPSAVVEEQEEPDEGMSQDFTITESLTYTIPAIDKQTQTASPTLMLSSTEAPSVGATLINEKDGAELVYIPVGDFLMGSEDSEADDNEKPVHTVFLDAYWIYKHEVTNAQFAEFLNVQNNQEEGGVTWLDVSDPDAQIHLQGSEWMADSGYEGHPVVEVSWYGAQAYCDWVGGRLPTEAEWEKAARGTDGEKYPWGATNPTCSLAKFEDCPGHTVAVGMYPGGASPYGVLDMAGNVWEWCSDLYAPDYYSQVGNNDNPQGPIIGNDRILRGGAESNNEWDLRTTVRGRNDPGKTNSINGFRCLVPESQIEPEQENSEFDLEENLINEKDKTEMVYIPEGDFLMGNEDGYSDESPEHTVFLDAYWISKHEVTNQQFAEFIEDTDYVTDAEKQGWSWVFNDESAKVSGVYWARPESPGSNLNGRQDHPVVHVSYDDASAYCHWAEGRLPTEAEWEMAARGADGRLYPWGGTQPTCTIANFVGCAGRTLPVGTHPNSTSPYGVMDMAGNVWEWVSDWYSSSFYGLSPINNPQGPVSGEMYVIRGGGWTSEIDYLRVTNRYWSKANDTSNDHGFRCVFPTN